MGEERPLTAADRLPEEGDWVEHVGDGIIVQVTRIEGGNMYGQSMYDYKLYDVVRRSPQWGKYRYSRRADGGPITTTEPAG